MTDDERSIQRWVGSVAVPADANPEPVEDSDATCIMPTIGPPPLKSGASRPSGMAEPEPLTPPLSSRAPASVAMPAPSASPPKPLPQKPPQPTANAAPSALPTPSVQRLAPATHAPLSRSLPPHTEGPAIRPAPLDHSLPGLAPQVTETLPGGTEPGAPLVRQVGRYQIGERLGRGGMATVFRAHDPQIGRDVAIKFLHATLCEDEEYHARFLREARAAGGLSHPNIVTVHDVGEIDGRPYMAMEVLDGLPLSDEMANGKPLPVRDVVIMGIQLARALSYAHSRGIVHRDIKPGNLMRVKGTRTIKVTDFGIAHMESAGSEHRTRVGDILGTPQYMSPEQAQGEKLDGRSDLFSTGILLYQMLTGQRPFLGDSLVALAMKIAKDEPIPIEKLRPDLPASLRRIVERCLAKSPDRRFQTGDELSDALGRVLADLDEGERKKNKPRMVPLARQVGGDDGPDRRRRDGIDRGDHHAAPVRRDGESGRRFGHRTGAFHRGAERGRGAF